MSEYSQHTYQNRVANDEVGAKYLWSALLDIERETHTDQARADKVLPVTAEQLLYARQFGSLSLKSSDDSPHLEAVSYAGAGLPVEMKGKAFSEIGSLVTKEADRGNHLATANMEANLDYTTNHGQVPIAFANNNSLPIFEKHGFVVVPPEHYDEIPPEYFGACAECPALQYAQEIGRQCCDTLVMFEDDQTA